MNKQKITFVAFLFLSLFLILLRVNNAPKPITLQASGVLSEMTIDDKIETSDLIIIGEVRKVLPSRWNTSRTIHASDLTSKEIIETGLGIFTDAIFTDKLVLKGDVSKEMNLRVRSFMGTIENISIISSSEPLYEEGKTYLLFLHKDSGPTQAVDPGDYIAVNAINGVYEIMGDKAISADDEWPLNDLVTYIQESPFSLPAANIPETSEAREIMRIIELAYDIEARAAFDLKTENFSTVFANSLAYSVIPEKLEFTQNFSNTPIVEAPGYLDYKLAYYNWWRDSANQFDSLKAKAKSENREVTQDELKVIIDSEWSKKWGLAPAQAESPERNSSLRFVSIDITKNNATAYLDDGFKVVILYLERIDEQWFIVGDKENTNPYSKIP